MWRLRQATVTEKEAEVLLQANVSNHLMQKYMGWRRSLLMFSLPSVLLSSIFSFIGIAGIVWESLNGLGVIAVLLSIISPPTLFVALCFSTYFWNDLVKSANICAYGWLFSLLAPIWPALLPIDYLLANDLLQQTTAEKLLLARFSLGISYSLQILPLIITIPSGALRGSLRVRGLLPECSLAGWFIVLIAPIVPLTIFAAMVLMTQLFGNALLLVGVVLLLVAPTFYVFRRKLYTEALTTEQDRGLEWNQRIMTILSICGAVMIGIWALTNDIFPSVVDVLLFLCEWVGRALSSTVVFADTVFRMTLHQLQIDRKRQDNGHYAEVDMLLASIPKDFDGDEQNAKNETKDGAVIDSTDDVEGQKKTMPDETESTDWNSSFHVSQHEATEQGPNRKLKTKSKRAKK